MYEVRVGKFESIEKTETSIRYTIDDKSQKDILCLKYDEYMIDIDSGNIYPIVKRKDGIIERNQKIVTDRFYALYINEYKAIDVKNYLKAIRTKLFTVNKLSAIDHKIKKI